MVLNKAKPSSFFLFHSNCSLIKVSAIVLIKIYGEGIGAFLRYKEVMAGEYFLIHEQQ